MGGAKERFDSRTLANSGDTRNLVTELQTAGFTYLQNRTQLNALAGGASTPDKLLGLFRTGNMDVAYDKLHLQRPPGEPTPNFLGFTDQPFLDEMTSKAIATLSKGGAPFIRSKALPSTSSRIRITRTARSGTRLNSTKRLASVVHFSAMDRTRKTQRFCSLQLIMISRWLLSERLIRTWQDQSRTCVSNTPYPATSSPPPAPAGGGNPGESSGFPDYEDENGDRYPENLNRFKIAVGYRTGNHTGSSVPITAEGTGALLFFGYYDQTDVFFKMARLLSTNTKQLDKAVEQKLQEDVPAFNPPAELRRGQNSKAILEQP